MVPGGFTCGEVGRAMGRLNSCSPWIALAAGMANPWLVMAAPLYRTLDEVFALVVVHAPIHASWLNQIEIYFSIVQRRVLTSKDFNSLTRLRERLRAFQRHCERAAPPFRWKFTRRDLRKLLVRLSAKEEA